MNTIFVTAFFDIGRSNVQIKGMERNNQKYLEYFKHWARIKNLLVVYTSEEFADKIYQIRQKYGLGLQTTVIVIDNILDICPDIFKEMKKIEEDNEWGRVRLHYPAMSSAALYDYLMLLKYWFIKDAQERTQHKGFVSWIDFGFDHGGEKYKNEQNFSFLWEPILDELVPVHIFALNDPKQHKIFEMLLLQNDSIMGCLTVIRFDACCLLWQYMLEAVKILLDIDVIDDDQLLLTLALKKHPDFFQIHYSDWFLPLKEYGGFHLELNEKSNIYSDNVINRTKNIVKQFFYLCNKDHYIDEFGRRIVTFVKTKINL